MYNSMRAMEENHAEEIREGNWYEKDEEGPSRGYIVNGHEWYAQYLTLPCSICCTVGGML